MTRVLSAANVVFTTCNNSGSDLLMAGFSPHMVLIDEAGQVNMPSMAIPLTVSPQLLATWYFGDYQQLRPKHFAASFKEFAEAAQMSAISFFEQKGWPVLRLDTQYRMCPAISQWLARTFYDGNLKNHPSIIDDTIERRVFRQITATHYGRRHIGGSELIGINVNLGRSVKQRNGTSLYNVAHAIAIAEFAIHLLMTWDSISGDQIVILIYYAAQYDILVEWLIRKAPDATIQERVRKIRIFTVDKYQGEQAFYVLLDTVVAMSLPPKMPSNKRIYSGRLLSIELSHTSCCFVERKVRTLSGVGSCGRVR